MHSGHYSVTENFLYIEESFQHEVEGEKLVTSDGYLRFECLLDMSCLFYTKL